MSRPKTFAILIGVCLLIFAAYLFIGRKHYGTVSDRGYQYAQALYSCCNRRDAAKLEVIAGMIEQSRKADEITQRETGWLSDIVQQSRDGDWAAASHAVRQLMIDQVSDG